MSKLISKPLSVKILKKSKWLTLKEKIFLDKNQNEHKWECVSRNNCEGAVAIIATLQPSNQIIIIRQFRPALDQYIIECPAGLIDKGETPETTAERELLEETGYYGEVISIFPKIYSSPGLTDEGVYIAFMNIDENAKENQNIQQNLEATEDIEVFTIQKDKLLERLIKFGKEGDLLDAKLTSFAFGIK